MLLHRSETSSSYLFTQKQFFHTDDESNFTVVGNSSTLENWGATQVKLCIISVVYHCKLLS